MTTSACPGLFTLSSLGELVSIAAKAEAAEQAFQERKRREKEIEALHSRIKQGRGRTVN